MNLQPQEPLRRTESPWEPAAGAALNTRSPRTIGPTWWQTRRGTALGIAINEQTQSLRKQFDSPFGTPTSAAAPRVVKERAVAVCAGLNKRHSILRAVRETPNCSRTHRSKERRLYDRTLKVARTVADLAGSETLTSDDVSEAIQFRSLDRQLRG